MLVPTNDSTEEIKNMKNCRLKSEINLDDYDEKYMRIKFNSDNKLPLNKRIEIPKMTIVVRAVFHENNKYYPQVFLDECLHKI